MRRDIRIINLAVFLWGVGEGLFITIQPLYIEALGANPAQIGGVLSLMALAAALTYLPAGYLADRVPRKPALLGGWVCGVLAMLIAALARDWRALTVAIVIYGASAYSVPILNTYLATAAEGQRLGRVFTTNIAFYTTGVLLAPTVGGLLAEWFSMRAVYLISAGIFGLSLLVMLQITPQRALLRPHQGEGWQALRGGRPLRFAAWLWFSFLAMYVSFPLGANFVADVRRLSTAQVGMMGSVYAVGMTVFSLLLGRLDGGRRPWGIALAQGLVWMSALLLALAPGVGATGCAFFLRGAYLACRGLSQGRAGNLLGATQRGLSLAVAQTAMSLAEVIGAMVAGRLYAARPDAPFIATLVAVPVMMVITLALPEFGGVQEVSYQPGG